mmetsp:Transcript_24132/g.66637  ORF Transcript_24132/g.66637 Transcript_24132/m.66637 type:complete len:191 (-) Transcript_24132:514-1086(-)
MSAASAAAASAAAASRASDAAAAARFASAARLQFLLHSAHEHAHTAPELSRHLVLHLLRLARTADLKLPQRLLQRLCRDCGSILVPGVNSRIAVCKRKRKNPAKRRALLVHCIHCSGSSHFPLQPKLSARVVANVPSSAGAQSLRSNPKAKPRARAGMTATNSAAPTAALQSTSTPTGSQMFGFDFISLR